MSLTGASWPCPSFGCRIQAVQTVVPASQRAHGLSPAWSDEEVQLRWFAPLCLAQAAPAEGAVASAPAAGIGGEPVAPLLIQSALHLLQQLAKASVCAAALGSLHAGLARKLNGVALAGRRARGGGPLSRPCWTVCRRAVAGRLYSAPG